MHIYYNIAPTDKSRASVTVYALLLRTRDHEHPYIMSTEVIITSVDGWRGCPYHAIHFQSLQTHKLRAFYVASYTPGPLL